MSNRDDLKEVPEVYNGHTAEEWYTKYCQMVVELRSLKESTEGEKH